MVNECPHEGRLADCPADVVGGVLSKSLKGGLGGGGEGEGANDKRGSERFF